MILAVSLLVAVYWLAALLLVARICGPALPKETRRRILGGTSVFFGLYLAFCAVAYIEHSGVLGPKGSLDYKYGFSAADLCMYAFLFLGAYLIGTRALLFRFPILLITKGWTQAIEMFAREFRPAEPDAHDEPFPWRDVVRHFLFSAAILLVIVLAALLYAAHIEKRMDREAEEAVRQMEMPHSGADSH